MQVADIARLVKYKLEQHGTRNTDTSMVSLHDGQLDAASVSIAAELSTRISRPVVTITRDDILRIAHAAGLSVEVRGEPPFAAVVPVDKDGDDIYELIHSIADQSVMLVLSRLPEEAIKKELEITP